MLTFREEKTEPAGLVLGQLKPGTWFSIIRTVGDSGRLVFLVVTPALGRHCACIGTCGDPCTAVGLHNGQMMTYDGSQRVVPVILLGIAHKDGAILWREARPEEFPQFLKDVPQPDAEVT